MERLLAGCARVVQQSPHLSLDDDAVGRCATSAPERLLAPPTWDGAGMYDGTDDRVVAWLLAYNAVNFCYWTDDGGRWWTMVQGRPMGADDEALGVMGAFAQALRDGVPLDDGRWLAGLDMATLEGLLAPAPGAAVLPMMPERLAGLRELGRAYLGHGGPLGLLAAAGGSAVRLAELLTVACPLWSDARLVPGGEVLRFRKRAQLCAAMIAGRFERRGPGDLRELERLTAFADYRLPQILRGLGILELAPDLAGRIDRGEEIPPGSAEEVALRAAAVAGADALRVALQARVPNVDALTVDHLLWRSAVEQQDQLPAFHRTRTTAY